MKARSLRRDLALGLGAGLMVLWILAMLGAALIVREELDEIYDSLMEETADRIAPFAHADANSGTPQAEPLLSWVLRDGDRIVRRSDRMDPADFATVPPSGFSTMDDRRHLVREVDGMTLDVSSPLQERREAFHGVMSALFLPAILLLPVCLLGIVWFTNRRLRPVATLSAEVAGRNPRDLRPLHTSGLPAELVPMRDEMNRLMRDLEQALQAEKSFAANAAHELRTPIAATLAHVQLLCDATEGPVLARAQAAERELKRVGRVAEKLLQLARAEHGRRADATVDVAMILPMIASDFGLRAKTPSGPVMWRIDPDAFAIVARNLIENAVTHGHDAEVFLDPDGTLHVANGGRTHPPEVLSRLTRRFERAGARTAGSGLGLAIVAMIARTEGLELHLSSPRPLAEDGFEVRIRPAPV